MQGTRVNQRVLRIDVPALDSNLTGDPLAHPAHQSPLYSFPFPFIRFPTGSPLRSPVARYPGIDAALASARPPATPGNPLSRPNNDRTKRPSPHPGHCDFAEQMLMAARLATPGNENARAKRFCRTVPTQHKSRRISGRRIIFGGTCCRQPHRRADPASRYNTAGTSRATSDELQATSYKPGNAILQTNAHGRYAGHPENENARAKRFCRTVPTQYKSLRISVIMHCVIQGSRERP